MVVRTCIFQESLDELSLGVFGLRFGRRPVLDRALQRRPARKSVFERAR